IQMPCHHLRTRIKSMTISAKIILDSINPWNGIRLITSELTYPRIIHAEFMTHRMFSRNAASSRAIPISKMMKMVQDNPAMPVYWGKNMKGMSSDSLVSDVESAKACWIAASKSAIESAVQLTKHDLHKQITNRVLEPFQYITVICTATEYSNFFKLRDHKDAQPEIAELAKIWRAAQDSSEPQERIWHIPYIQEDEKG